MSRASSSSASCIQLAGTIHTAHLSAPVAVLVDSGADDNFIHRDFALKHNLATYELSTPKEVLAIDGKILELVTHRTQPVNFWNCL